MKWNMYVPLWSLPLKLHSAETNSGVTRHWTFNMILNLLFQGKKITLWCFMWQLATSFLASCQKHGWIIRTWYSIWGGALLKLLGGSCSQKRAKFIYFCVIPNVIGPNNYPSIVSQPLQCIPWHCSYQLWPLGKVGFKVGLLSWRLQLHSALHVRHCRDGDRQAGL